MAIPEIRFVEFDGDWEDVEIGSVSTGDHGGGTPSTAKREFWEGTIPWIQSSDLEPGETTPVKPTKHITHEAIKSSAASVVPPNSLAIVTRVGVGKLAPMPFPYATSQDFISLSGLTGDINFLAIAIQQAILKDIGKLQGSTIKGMTRSDILNKRIQVPLPVEQKAIGNYFRNLDELIRLGVTRLTKLRNLKSTMLVKMFPQVGSTVPEIRFAGFDGEWEKYSLSDFGRAISGVGFPHSEQGGKSGIPFFKVSDMNSSGNELTLHKAAHYVTKEQIDAFGWKPITETPAIFFAKVGAAVMSNRKRLVKIPFLLDNNTMAFTFDKSKLLPAFAGVFFANIDLTKLVQVGALPSYNARQVEAIQTLLPSPAEQEAIGNYFRNLDTLIGLEEDKLTKLKNLKSALLDKMFV